jgi:hypothetical protein
MSRESRRAKAQQSRPAALVGSTAHFRRDFGNDFESNVCFEFGCWIDWEPARDALQLVRRPPETLILIPDDSYLQGLYRHRSDLD